jgi:hypothetical protein
MGILDDFIKTIKGQREQFKAEQKRAEEERATKEREKAAVQKAPEGKPSEQGYVGEIAERIKEQRREFEEAQKKAAEEKKHPPTEKRGPIQEFEHRIKEQRREFEEAQKKGRPAGKTVQEQKVREAVELFGHTFKHEAGMSPHLWLDEAAKAVYIDDVDAYLKSGGKVEVKGVTAAMDPYMYDIFTNQGGPVGQARYYRQDNVIVSLVPDPFAKYRK